jgi:hypothetical protein
MAQVEEDYTVGERVEAQDHMRDTWYPGVIYQVGSYDVRANASGRTMNRARSEVRDPTSHETGEFMNLRVGSPVEIKMSNNTWVPGTLLKKNYSIRLDRDGGRIGASHTEIRRPGNAQAPTPEQAAAIRAAFEQQEAVRRAEAEQRVAQQMREEQRLAAERQAEERRLRDLQINQIYSIGDRVEVRLPGTTEWHPATIVRIGTLVVRNNSSGREMNKMPNEVRDPETLQTGETANLRINGPVGIKMARNNWVLGVLLSKNYRVRLDNAYEEVVTTQFLRRPQGQAEAPAAPAEAPAAPAAAPEAPRRAVAPEFQEVWNAAQRQQERIIQRQNMRAAQPAVRPPPPQPAGVAFEIHNAFDNFKINEFMKIINISIYRNREAPLQPLIDNVNANANLSPEKKTELTQKIDRIFNTLKQYSNYQEKLDNIIACIQYVLMQPQDFIDIYIDTFITDCLKAYTTGNAQSCVKGMYERVYFAFRDTVSTICLDQIQGTGNAPLCKPEYIKIFDCFYENIPTELLNEYSQQWFQERSESAESMSPENRIEDFVSFVREKINNPSKFSKGEASIRRYADQNINVLFGGRRRRRKTVKKRKSNQAKKTRRH